jgi:F0F1-type ATP synthase membrane subunit b/b'
VAKAEPKPEPRPEPKADKKADQAKAEADRKRAAEAKAEEERKRADARAEADRKRAEAKAEADRKRADARAEEERKRAEARAEADRKREQAKAEEERKRLAKAEAAKPAEKPVQLPDATTALSPEAVQKVVSASRRAFEGCIADAAKRGTDTKFDGRKVALRLNVNPNGFVTYPTLDDVTLNRTDLGECLKSAARLMVFPKFQGDVFHVEVPLTLRGG